MQIESGEIHVWQAEIPRTPEFEEGIFALLSREERERAMRMRNTASRHRFVYARSVLRRLLGAYLDVPPQDVAIGYGAAGKPLLAGAAPECEWHFNLSHSGDVLLVAVSRDRAVGVDVERVRPEFDFWSVARRYWAAEEVRRLFQVDRALRRRIFFQVWVRKEAFVKAQGGGIALGLDRFIVSVLPGEAPAVRLSPELAQRLTAREWSLWDLDVGSGYAGALCAVGLGGVVRRLQWPADRATALASPSTEGAWRSVEKTSKMGY